MTIWAQTSPTKVVGEAVVTPDKIELEYAALGEDGIQQAVLAVETAQNQLTFAAVAVPTPQGWKRIAAFDCWCKYEMYSGRDALAEFVQLRPLPEPGPVSPEHFELILRSSGGGTGIYTQYEVHFRLYHDKLRRVISFVSRHLSCSPGEPCDLVRRWFSTTTFGDVVGGVLVKSRGSYTGKSQLPVSHLVRDLENRLLQRVSCSTYQWNKQDFRYEPFGVANPCEPTN